MKNINKVIFTIMLSTALLSCKKEEESHANADTISAAPAVEVPNNELAESQISSKAVSSSAAVENNKDGKRQFIRTAELKFKVKNVLQSTEDIENIVSKNEGFVTFTNLISEINDVDKTPVSKENSLETKYFTVTNTMTIRVPNTKLDATLKEIARNIDFLDSRQIKADDVALVMLANQLTVKNSTKNEDILTNSIDNNFKKIPETIVGTDVLETHQDKIKNAKIANLSLKDQVELSTINLSIYQRQAVKRELLANNQNIDVYEPNFGHKILESLKFGWEIFADLIVFLTKLWGFFLAGFLIVFAYKKYGHKFKEKI